FSLRTEIMPNWPITAYLSGLVLAAPWFVRQLTDGPRAKRACVWISACAAVLIGLTTTYIIHDTAIVRPLLTALAGPATDDNPQALRRFDPTSRLRGWRVLPPHDDQTRSQ
ncbi:MAG: hypothetical protein ACJ8F7_20870, partial [Gemmataceae bacterium]